MIRLKISEFVLNLKDRVLGSNLVKNFIVVFLGDGISAVLSLLGLSIMINVLGYKESSIFNLVVAYCLLFDTLFNFQSFNAVIKFLPKVMQENDIDGIKSYLKQGFILDIITSLISFSVANLLLEMLGHFFNWDNIIINFVRVYSFTILINITGTCIGIIRVYDKFKYSSYINMIVSSFRFIFYIISFVIKVNIWYFIFVEMIFALLNTVLIFSLTIYTLNKNKIYSLFKYKIKWNREFLSFNFYCNLMTTLDVPISHLTPFLIERFIGINFISVYKIIEKIGGIIAKFASPISNIIYPEISKKVTSKKNNEAVGLVKKLFFLICVVGVLILVCIAFTYKIWINILIPEGQMFITNIMLYVAFVIFKFSFIGVYPLFISLGYVKKNVYIVVLANFIYLCVIPILSRFYNINGVIFSQFIQVFIVIFLQGMIIKRSIDKI